MKNEKEKKIMVSIPFWLAQSKLGLSNRHGQIMYLTSHDWHRPEMTVITHPYKGWYSIAIAVQSVCTVLYKLGG